MLHKLMTRDVNKSLLLITDEILTNEVDIMH